MSSLTSQTKLPGLSLGGLLAAIAARWKLVSIVSVPVGVAVTAVTWVALPAEYTARATVRCRLSTPSLLEPAPRLDKDATAAHQREMLATLKSSPVLSKAVTTDGVRDLPLIRSQPDPAGWLAGRLRAGFAEDTEFLSLSLAGLAPKDQAEVLNALADAFGFDLNERARKRRVDDGIRLQKAIDDTRSQALKQREELATMLGGIKARDLNDPKWQFDLAMAAALNADLVKLRGELRRQKELVAQLKAQLPELENQPVPPVVLEAALAAIPEVLKADAMVLAAEKKLAEKTDQLSMNSPELGQFRLAVETARLEAKKVRAAQTDPATRELRRKAKESIEAQISRCEQEIVLLNGQEKSILKEQEDHPIQGVAPVAPEVEIRRQEVEQLEALYRNLRDKRERMNLELRSSDELDVVTVVARADEPKAADVKGQAARAGGAGVAAVGVVATLIGLWEWSRRRVHSRDQLAGQLGLRVLGSLPWFGIAPPPPTGSITGPGFESADAIRTMLLADESPDRPQVILITSAAAGEGKTILAMQLAASLARAGRRTLLVDADLRRPTLHTLLNLEGPGLSDGLVAGRSGTHLVQSLAPNLGVLTAGTTCINGLAALPRVDQQRLYQRWLQSWEFVVIDTPPVLAAPDALILSKGADGVVLSVRPTVSRLDDVGEATRLLSGVGANVLGAVWNGARGPRIVYPYQPTETPTPAPPAVIALSPANSTGPDASPIS